MFAISLSFFDSSESARLNECVPCSLGGYYSVQTKQSHRIIALNTNLYYNDKETEGITDPADQLVWLEDQLKKAASRNEKV